MTHLSWTVGDVTITRIHEIMADLPPVGLLPEAPPKRWPRTASGSKRIFFAPMGKFRCRSSSRRASARSSRAT